MNKFQMKISDGEFFPNYGIVPGDNVMLVSCYMHNIKFHCMNVLSYTHFIDFIKLCTLNNKIMLNFLLECIKHLIVRIVFYFNLPRMFH